MSSLVETTPGCYQLKGTINLDTTMDFRRELESLVRFEENVALDLSVVEIEGSAILSLLVYAYRAASHAGGSVKILQPPEKLRKIARLAGITSLLSLPES
jgi:anti-anti-sigma factor